MHYDVAMVWILFTSGASCAYVSSEGHKSDQKSEGLPDHFADANPCNLSVFYLGGLAA